ncbi:MAG: threonine/serine dehydratase [Actinomycetota bacterium]
MSRAMPTLDGAHAAARRIEPYLPVTPLYRYPGLDRIVGTETWVKHENHQPVGAFKVRGGVNLVAQLDAAERARGLVAASTGNHGQSVAYAARLFDVDATIVVPESANPAKVASMQGLGAEVVFHGRDFDDALVHCEALAGQRGARYIHSGNEPQLIEGVGTYALEMLRQQDGIDVVIVPVGGGSGAAGTCIAGKGTDPNLRVIGVQSSGAPAAFRSWSARALVADEMRTSAEGLATRTAFELPQRILWDLLDDFVLVDDDEIERAVALMIDHTRNLVEAAGAAPLAAALKLKDILDGARVALVCSGGNITLAQLEQVLSRVRSGAV